MIGQQFTMFRQAMHDYKELPHVTGIFSFRPDSLSDSTMSMIYNLHFQGVFSNSSISLDFNPSANSSFISFGGVNTSSVDGGEYGVTYLESLSEDLWQVPFTNASFGNKTFSSKNNGKAELATASKNLMIPTSDFINLLTILRAKNPDIDLTSA